MNRTIDDIAKGRTDRKNLFVVLLVLLLLSSAILGLLVLKSFVGFVYQNYAVGKAGYVYQLVLDYRECATMWSGVYGVAVMVNGYTNQQSLQVSSCGMYDVNLLFNCLQPHIDHEVMASLVPPTSIDWSTLQSASTVDVDTLNNIDPMSLTSTTKTFTQTYTYQIGTQYYRVPGTSTKKTGNDTTNVFDLGILKDGQGNIIFITHALANFTQGFNGKIYNYQMILPVKNGTNPVYYFFTDPNDVCPVGEGAMPNSGIVIGNVTTSVGAQLDSVIIDVAGKTTISDANGAYNLTTYAGSYYIYAIKSGYQAYVGNITVVAGNTTVYNIVMVPEAVPNPNTGMGTSTNTNNNVGPGQGVGPGRDVGPGEAPAVPIVEQPKRIEGVDYVISLNKIDRKLVIGNFLQEVITFYSYKKGPVNLNFSIEGENLSKMIKMDKASTVISPNTNDELTLTIFGEGDPGIYNGSLVIDGGLQQKIPIRIELLTKDRLPVESLLIFLDVYNKNIFSSDQLKFKTDLHNMLTDQSYPVTLQFTIQNQNGTTVWSDRSNVYVQTSFSLLKSAQLPKNLANGDYVLRVTADYLGLSSASSAVFSIVSPFYEQYFYGMKVWLWLLIAAIALSGFFAGLLVRRYIQSRKRYSAKVDYAELPKVSPKSAFVGKIAETEHKTYFDLEQFKVHTIVAGATGGGKSVAAQVIVEEALLKNIAVIVFDPTAQWSGMLRKGTDKNMLKLYSNFGMKPTDARSFNGNVRQITNALEVIDIKKYIKPGEIQIFAVNKLDPKDIDIFVANSIREVFHANFPETPEIKLLIVYDEVHRLLPKFGGSGEGFLQIERGCREFRKWGVGILMISQVLADFVGQIKANINTEIQMRTRDEGDLDRIKTKYGSEVLQGLVKASVGTGMVENPAYNRGKPYFVSFRPLLHNTQRLPDEELEKYNKYNEMIDDLQYQLEQLEEEKQDVFDLKLELKLALDKVKSGNFNMVEIYLQELVPRVEKSWQKLGKKPKKRELKLVDVSSLKAEMKKAEESRKEYEKTVKKEETVKVEEKKVLKYDRAVDFNKAMNFSNGVSVTSLQELLDVMPNITGPTFKHHVTKEKNDIADWVEKVMGDTALASRLREAKVTEEFVKILEDDKAKNNKPVSVQAQPVVETAQVPESREAPVVTPAVAAVPASSPASSPAPTVQNPPEQSSPEEDVRWQKIKDRLSGLDSAAQIALLEKSKAKYPQDLNIRFSLGLLYHKEKQFDKSAQIYQEILAEHPSNAKALLYLAGSFKVQKNYDAALDYFARYLALKPDDAKVHALVAHLKSKLNKT